MENTIFRKPFRGKPVVLGDYALAREARRRRQQIRRRIVDAGRLAILIGVFGWLATHLDNLPKLPVYYRNCDAARAAGAAPIRQGEPGYRTKLDADSDGIACEPYSR
jgi:Excalibur calcium-binding domain